MTVHVVHTPGFLVLSNADLIDPACFAGPTPVADLETAISSAANAVHVVARAAATRRADLDTQRLRVLAWLPAGKQGTTGLTSGVLIEKTRTEAAPISRPVTGASGPSRSA